MKALISKMAMVMALLTSVAFVACSDDDDENKEGTVDVSSSKHIVRETYDDGGYTEVTEYKYDSQGRVILKTETELSSRRSSSATTTYSYRAGVIESKTKGDWNDGQVHYYYLWSGGLIQQDRIEGTGYNRNIEYDFDSDSHLLKLIFSGGGDDGEIEFSWYDGVITKYTKTLEDGSDYTYYITYTKIPWPKNFFLYWDGTNIDAVLEPLGAIGKMPRFLPSKMERSGGKAISIDYVVENGLVTKVKYGSETRVLEWE